MKMNGFEQFNAARSMVSRADSVLRNLVPGERPLRLLWLFPDVVNLHGGRGDIMALLHVADLMQLPLEIIRHDSPEQPLDFARVDLIFLNSGELKCGPELTAALRGQMAELQAFLSRGGLLIAVGSSGSVLARETRLLDGSSWTGLGLLDMQLQERSSVWGDDLWFRTEEGIEVIGNQIQVADVMLDSTQAALGETVYGRGNCGDGGEGARSGGVIFTNGLGPLLVKNPRLAAHRGGRCLLCPDP